MRTYLIIREVSRFVGRLMTQLQRPNMIDETLRFPLSEKSLKTRGVIKKKIKGSSVTTINS